MTLHDWKLFFCGAGAATLCIGAFIWALCWWAEHGELPPPREE